jgi:hypothetical protein
MRLKFVILRSKVTKNLDFNIVFLLTPKRDSSLPAVAQNDTMHNLLK